ANARGALLTDGSELHSEFNKSVLRTRTSSAISCRTQVLAPFALFFLFGCSDDATTKVVDSTGLEAQRVCGSDDCETELTGTTSCGDDVVLLGGADFLLLCTSVRDAVFNENCRP